MIRLTFDHIYVIGTVPHGHGDSAGVFFDQRDDVSLLSGCDTAAEHRLTALRQAHECGPPFWPLVKLCLEHKTIKTAQILSLYTYSVHFWSFHK